jgi:hypothetical protein
VRIILPSTIRPFMRSFLISNLYVGFLHWMGELDVAEAGAFSKYEGWLKEVESTGMAKSYKMVLLLAMLGRGVSFVVEAGDGAKGLAQFEGERFWMELAGVSDV